MLTALDAQQLTQALVLPADVADLGLGVETHMGTNPSGIESGTGRVGVGTTPSFSAIGVFGFVDGADSQPCAALLNALGHGQNAPTPKTWAEIDYAPVRSVDMLITETVALYAPGKAAGAVAAVAAAPGGACRQVTAQRVAPENDTVQTLAVGPVGDASAGVQTAIPVRAGSVDYFAAEAQVGDYLMALSGTQTNRNGPVVLDKALITEVLTHAVAKLTAAAR